MGYYKDDRVYRDWVPVTPGDTSASNLALGVNGISAAGAGNVTVVSQQGNVAVFAIAAGGTLHIGPLRVNATGTTATGIIALY